MDHGSRWPVAIALVGLFLYIHSLVSPAPSTSESTGRTGLPLGVEVVRQRPRREKLATPKLLTSRAANPIQLRNTVHTVTEQRLPAHAIIPIIVICRDRPLVLKSAIASYRSCLKHAPYRIMVYDMGSTNPSMLDYLAELEKTSTLSVVRGVYENWISGVQGVIDRFMKSHHKTHFYVVTDAETILDSHQCTMDLLNFFSSLLFKKPYGGLNVHAVGVESNTVDIPFYFPFAALAREDWGYAAAKLTLKWKGRPVMARMRPLGTSFAMYRRDTPFKGSTLESFSVVLDRYMSRHWDWYFNPNRTTADDRYYFSRLDTARGGYGMLMAYYIRTGAIVTTPTALAPSKVDLKSLLLAKGGNIPENGAIGSAPSQLLVSDGSYGQDVLDTYRAGKWNDAWLVLLTSFFQDNLSWGYLMGDSWIGVIATFVCKFFPSVRPSLFEPNDEAARALRLNLYLNKCPAANVTLGTIFKGGEEVATSPQFHIEQIVSIDVPLSSVDDSLPSPRPGASIAQLCPECWLATECGGRLNRCLIHLDLHGRETMALSRLATILKEPPRPVLLIRNYVDGNEVLESIVAQYGVAYRVLIRLEGARRKVLLLRTTPDVPLCSVCDFLLTDFHPSQALYEVANDASALAGDRTGTF